MKEGFPLTLTIELPSEIEAGLIARAQARGLPLEQNVRRFLVEQFAETGPEALSVGATGVLEKEADVWVLRTGQPITAAAVDDTVNAIRQERDLANLGSLRWLIFLTPPFWFRFFWSSTRTMRRACACFSSAAERMHFARHTAFAELYSTLTRLPLPHRGTGQAGLFLDSVCARLTPVHLDAGEYRRALQEASAADIVGGAVYDFLISRCASKVKASPLYTWNLRHYSRFGAELSAIIQAPAWRIPSG